MRTLDFEKNKVEVLTLDELKNSYRENDVYGKPLKEMYHYQVIEDLCDSAMSLGLKLQINEIFAAQNKDKAQPGVVLLPQAEKEFGEKSLQAHILRRVYANMQITSFDDSEFSTNLAVSFHQQGVQVGFGNMVKICHNQCMLSPAQLIGTYGNGRMPLTELLMAVKKKMEGYEQTIMFERQQLNKMKNVVLSANDLFQVIGELNTIRVACDTKEKSIRRAGTYPLSNTQLNVFVEKLLLCQHENERVTLWDLYNVGTEILKADKMEIPNVLNQHSSFGEYVTRWL